jgi:hypothetical protein
MVTVRYISVINTLASWDGGLAVRELVAQFRNFTAVIQPYTSVHVLQNISVGNDINMAPTLKSLGYIVKFCCSAKTSAAIFSPTR